MGRTIDFELLVSIYNREIPLEEEEEEEEGGKADNNSKNSNDNSEELSSLLEARKGWISTQEYRRYRLEKELEELVQFGILARTPTSPEGLRKTSITTFTLIREDPVSGSNNSSSNIKKSRSKTGKKICFDFVNGMFQQVAYQVMIYERVSIQISTLFYYPFYLSMLTQLLFYK